MSMTEHCDKFQVKNKYKNLLKERTNIHKLESIAKFEV